MNQRAHGAVANTTLNVLVVGNQHAQLIGHVLLGETLRASKLGNAPSEVVENPLGRLVHAAHPGACAAA